MKLAIGSDLHLEFGDLNRDLISDAAKDAGILILAGDIALAKDMAPYSDFFKNCSREFDHVIYVMGNHEHYHRNFDATYQTIKAWLPANIHLLEKESITIDGQHFVGGTLWTSCDGGDWFVCRELKDYLSDFRVIKREVGDTWRKFTPEDSLIEHRHTVMCIEKETTRDSVVVTHHAPSYCSVSEYFRTSAYVRANHGFFTDLDSRIMQLQPKLWVHGHMHDNFDYMIDQTRVVCNPRGYVERERQANNFKFQIVEV